MLIRSREYCIYFHPPARELMEERNREKLYHTDIGIQDPESPRYAINSDSDCYSEFSSRGTNFGEDDWMDEVPHEKGMSRELIRMRHPQENGERILSERLSQIALDDSQSNGNWFLDNKEDEDPLHSEIPMSTVPAAPEDSQSIASYCNGHQMPRKGNSRKAAQRLRVEMLDSLNDNSVLVRILDADPAVNIDSADLVSIKRKGNVVTMPMTPSHVQSSFPFGENIIYIPMQMVQPQQKASTNFRIQPQRPKWNEQRKFSRGLSSLNSKKQAFSQDKVSKPKEVRYSKQRLVSDNQQPSTMSPNFQARPVIVPLSTQRQGAFNEQGHSRALLSRLFMSLNGRALTFGQPQIRAGMEDSNELPEAINDTQLHPDELQNLVQDGHLPVVLMTPIMPRMPTPVTVDVKALHQDILHFARLSRPSAETQLHAEAAIDCVRKGVKMVWPDADVEVFGSFATGLCLQHSDVDLAVVGAPPLPTSEWLSTTQASAILIRELASALGIYEWCESINVIDTATMPVLKCHCRPFVILTNTSRTRAIAIDVTIGGTRDRDSVWNQATKGGESAHQVPRVGRFGTRHTGGAAREYVLQKLWDLPALAPLVLLLKSFLYHKGLSNVYSGGLGSFSLTLLVAFYLERVPNPRELFSNGLSDDLPAFPLASSPLSCTLEFSDESDLPISCSLGEHYVRRAANVMERVLALWDLGGSPYLGTFLLGFLHSFGFVLDLSCEKIILKGINGSPGGIFKREDRHVALWIDDPLRPGVNVGAGSFGMFHVQAAFREMLQVLTNGPLSDCPPCCTDDDCHDLAALGQLSLLRRLIMDVDDYH